MLIKCIREVRFLIEHKGVNRKLFKVAWAKEDNSLYFFPYGPTGKYYYGIQSFDKGEIKKTFPYNIQYNSIKIPKLSIHQSGQVHIRYHGKKIDLQLNTIPLEHWRGEHIATVTCDFFESLLEHKDIPKTTGSDIDKVIRFEKGSESGRIPIYVNAQSQNFNDPCDIKIPMPISSLFNPLYIGIAKKAQEPLSKIVGGGVTVIAGWNPRKSIKERNEFLFIQAT